MYKFTENNYILDLVEINYHLLPVINRFGIKLGNKDRSLGEICKLQKIDVNFLLMILNTFHNKEYFPEKELRSFSPLLIVDYLRKTHHYYTSYVLPKLDVLLQQLLQSDSTNSQQLSAVKMFYQKYTKELLLHIQEEEEKVFPYINSLLKGESPKTPYTIHAFEKEHTNVDTKLNDLKTLIVKYLDPVYDLNICNEFLITLFRFEKDIKDHARIEDKILILQVVELENKING